MTDAKSCLDAAQQRATDYYKKSKQDVVFSEGQMVLLSTKNLRSFAEGSRKLLPRWIGPYPVERMVGNAAVKLVLPADMNIHPTFHVSLIRPYRGTEPVANANDTPTAVEPGPETWIAGKQKEYDVERVLDYRTRRVGKHRRK
ncbi:hypothetical protein Vafri_16071 [Volvox africanus]|uniref:Tf2-1-like SH3-like domain-containing protein n=1 Tax=Volvox africanus TaxID=51714 RepID=A0A8J4F697_9CHLO|nr:hypothetical protein Vafri_16071 [Volvox africanus]